MMLITIANTITFYDNYYKQKILMTILTIHPAVGVNKIKMNTCRVEPLIMRPLSNENLPTMKNI